MKTYTIAELLGDGISGELSGAVHEIAAVLPFGLEFEAVDLSVESRARAGARLYDVAEGCLRRHGTGLKYPTATVAESPNKILRERCAFSVIHRPVATIPGIATNFKREIDVDVVRVGVGGTYEDAGRRIGHDTGVSLRVIERVPSRCAARFAFRLAAQRGRSVVATSKWTIQSATDGLFQEVCRNVASDFPGVPYREELFDALLAGVIMRPERYAVIVCPNEYGDFLSDTACGLIGSVGLGDSASFSFDDMGNVVLALFDPAGGTAPDIAGQGLCNPTAALLALASLLRHLGELECARSLRRAILDAIAAGQKTRDIGGQLSTRDFTAEVARRFQLEFARA